VHGCTIEDACLVGINATIMDGAVIGAGINAGRGAAGPAVGRLLDGRRHQLDGEGGDDGAGRAEHFPHAWSTFGTFVADDDHIAFLDFLFLLKLLYSKKILILKKQKKIKIQRNLEKNLLKQFSRSFPEQDEKEKKQPQKERKLFFLCRFIGVVHGFLDIT